MTFDDWWDSGPRITDPETYQGWEASCRAAWNAGARESAVELARLRAELERNALDAARYRWLRDRRDVTLATAFFGNCCLNKGKGDIDDYIDAALAQEPPA